MARPSLALLPFGVGQEMKKLPSRKYIHSNEERRTSLRKIYSAIYCRMEEMVGEFVL